jgi:hypothetical protein
VQQLKKFAQNTINKIVLPLFGFKTMFMISPIAGNAFFREYVSEMLYLGDTRTYLSTKRQGSIQMSLVGKLDDSGI